MFRTLSKAACNPYSTSLQYRLSLDKLSPAFSKFKCLSRLRAVRGFRSQEPSPLLSYVAKAPAKEQPSWRRLAEQIKGDEILPGSDDATESVYAARLRANYDRQDHVEKIEEEVLEEMAASLGRTGDKVNYHFLLLERQGRVCDAAVIKAEEAHRALKSCSVAQLQDQCRAAGLPISDCQTTLISHLLAGDSSAPIEGASSASKKTENNVSSKSSHAKARGTPHQALVAAVNEFNKLWSEAAAARRELTIHRQCVGFQTGNHSAIEKAWPLPPRRAVAALAAAETVSNSGIEAEEERNRTWLRKMEYLARK